MFIRILPLVPSLTHGLHKGQTGKISILGGSDMYTGAPFFAGMAAMKMGADLVTILTTPSASTVIKSYSPDLMVKPCILSEHYLNNIPASTDGSKDEQVLFTSVLAQVSSELEKVNVLVIGPGLGRDNFTIKCVEGIIKIAKNMKLPLIIDADGLFLIAQNPSIIHGYKNAVLTPNAMEFRRLWLSTSPSDDTSEPPPMEVEVPQCFVALQTQDCPDPHLAPGDLGLNIPIGSTVAKHTTELANRLGGVTVCRKGFVDVISDGKIATVCSRRGMTRRCGGQGDLLAGMTAVWLNWALVAQAKQNEKQSNMSEGLETRSELGRDPNFEKFSPTILAAFGGCYLTRSVAEEAFNKHYRSTLTSDLLGELPRIMQEKFPCENPSTFLDLRKYNRRNSKHY